ncbi:MAG: RNA polymerase sigma factor [Acidobacteria bacterium]|nr:RNA polymerase sigma factor [Acidobacteriota bacterium]
MTTTIVTREIALLRDAKDETVEVSSSLMDEDAFRAFYDRTSRGLWLFLVRVTGERQIADDLLQEAYYRFYRAGSTYESEGHRRNALFRIATNIARDAWRRRGGIVNTPIDEATASIVDHGMDERTDLARALERLKPKQREMLWLAYANGSSHEEIAEVVGVAPGSVKGLLRRARTKLAELLGNAPQRTGKETR